MSPGTKKSRKDQDSTTENTKQRNEEMRLSPSPSRPTEGGGEPRNYGYSTWTIGVSEWREELQPTNSSRERKLISQYLGGLNRD